ncbi:hypothetical protein FQN54_002650 [Arachnomyces sp. PD_36]|nr:hypothetical protein FQN54_002650 [Arachnomyces sp. PD_36]
MAKPRPSLPVAQMKSELGQDIDPVIDPRLSAGRLLSILKPISLCGDEKDIREFEELKRQRDAEEDGGASLERILPKSGEAHTISNGEDTIVLKRQSDIGFHSITVDAHYGFGVHLPLLFTNNEAARTMSVAKLKPNNNPLDREVPLFFRLPIELRNMIYTFAIPKAILVITDTWRFSEFSFARGIGDPSGFYSPLRKDLALLRVNRQMRQEALPFAYRRTDFHLDVIEEFITFAISIGKIGRDNIESLKFVWETRSDEESRYVEHEGSEMYLIKLPSLHISECVQLLKQCKRLKTLTLFIETNVASYRSLENFKADPSIRELSSVQGIGRVKLLGFGYPDEAVGWLKGIMESSKIEAGRSSLPKQLVPQEEIL